MHRDIGFTGSRKGMTFPQKSMLAAILRTKLGRFHHGECIGSDADAHSIAVNFALPIVGHPPDRMKFQARLNPLGFVERREPKPYIERNHDIVDDSYFLVATPGEFTEQRRSGTWATIRYARSKGKFAVIIYPDGSIGE